MAMTESPSGTYYHTFTNRRSWGCSVWRWPVYQSKRKSRRHPLPLILPHTFVKPWLRNEKKEQEARGLGASETRPVLSG